MQCLPHICPVEVHVSSPAAPPQLWSVQLLIMTTPELNMQYDTPYLNGPHLCTTCGVIDSFVTFVMYEL